MFFLIIGSLLIFLIIFLRFGPKEKILPPVSFNDEALMQGVDSYLKKVESAVPNIIPGLEKEVVWADEKEKQTDIAIIYLTGFSASKGEIKPVADRVAKHFNANLYYTRMPGHGRDSHAMGEVKPHEWLHCYSEAMAIGARIGKRLIIMGTSTGCTLAVVGSAHIKTAVPIIGEIFIAPNFGLCNRLSGLGGLSFFRYWGPLLGGKERAFEPMNEAHAKYWTTTYPIQSIVPMMRLLTEFRRLNLSEIKIPALFYYHPDDEVADSRQTKKYIAQWGGEVVEAHPFMTDADDPGRHVISGDALSPNQTQPAIDLMTQWISDHVE